MIAAAVACSEHPPHRRWTGRLLWLTAALGVGFLVVKGFEYGSEWNEHLFPGRGFALAATPGAVLFFWLYFVITGLHALHLAIGVGVVSVFAWGSARAAVGRPRRIEVAGAVLALRRHRVDLPVPLDLPRDFATRPANPAAVQQPQQVH